MARNKKLARKRRWVFYTKKLAVLEYEVKKDKLKFIKTHKMSEKECDLFNTGYQIGRIMEREEQRKSFLKLFTGALK